MAYRTLYQQQQKYGGAVAYALVLLGFVGLWFAVGILVYRLLLVLFVLSLFR